MLIAGNPSTMKMHMTGMENFNVASKRGPIPLNGVNSMNDSTSQGMADSRTITTNKSNMRKYLNLNFRGYS